MCVDRQGETNFSEGDESSPEGQCKTSYVITDIETRPRALEEAEATDQEERARLEVTEIGRWDWRLWHPEYTSKTELSGLA